MVAKRGDFCFGSIMACGGGGCLLSERMAIVFERFMIRWR